MATYQDLEDSVLEAIGRLQDSTIQDILKRRMGLGTGRAQTLEEVGEVLGLTREAVLQKEREGLEQMRSLSSQEAEEFRNSDVGGRLLKSLLEVTDE